MSQYVFTAPLVTLNSTVITSSVKAARINITPDMLDNTVFGMTAKSRKRGLEDWNVELDIFGDEASAGLDEGLWTLFHAGTTFTVIVRPTTAIRSQSNPDYSGKGKLESFSFGGAVGEMGQQTLRILAAGASIARTTSAS